MPPPCPQSSYDTLPLPPSSYDALPLSTEFLRYSPPVHRVPTMLSPCPEFLRCYPPDHSHPMMTSPIPPVRMATIFLLSLHYLRGGFFPHLPFPSSHTIPPASTVSAPAQAPVYQSCRMQVSGTAGVRRMCRDRGGSKNSNYYCI